MLTLLLLATASAHAQVAPLSPPPPVPGFVSSYEIMHTLRSAGFNPLAPPLREGTTYLARATDYRGILMRVVLDARTGAIRDANRIVSGPDAYGEVGMLPPSDDAPPPYGAPLGFDPEELSPGAQLPTSHQATRATVTIFPPLPRPRPAELAARSPAFGTPEFAIAPAPGAKADAKAAATIDPKPDAKADMTSSGVPAAPASKSPKPGKAPASGPIND